MEPAELCQVCGLTRSAHGRTLLDDVTISFGRGVTALLGPNGAGKTTLLRVLATVTRPTSGRVRVLGFDPAVPGDRTEIRRRLGYVPQELSFPRGFTVYGFVEYVAVLKELTGAAERRRQIGRVLELTDLAAVASEKVHRLSGGTRRRVAVAQALLGSPEVLLLDEPATGLDPDQRMLLHRVVDDSSGRATVVLATQQTADVGAWCDRIAMLDTGRLVFQGSVAEFVEHAAGRVWISDEVDPSALATTTTLDGRFRQVGRPPSGVATVPASVDDAYLLLRHATAGDVA